tara:strand:- start:9363 stop:10013 length:651 start_codon:yes stop_codon:yes gene_type:complete
MSNFFENNLVDFLNENNGKITIFSSCREAREYEFLCIVHLMLKDIRISLNIDVSSSSSEIKLNFSVSEVINSYMEPKSQTFNRNKKYTKKDYELINEKLYSLYEHLNLNINSKSFRAENFYYYKGVLSLSLDYQELNHSKLDNFEKSCLIKLLNDSYDINNKEIKKLKELLKIKKVYSDLSASKEKRDSLMKDLKPYMETMHFKEWKEYLELNYGS